MKSIFPPAILLLVGVSTLSGKGTQESSAPAIPIVESAGLGEASFPQTVADARGGEVILNAVPQRIVSLGPNITELIYVLHREDFLVGRTDWCDYHSEVSAVPSVGTLREPNVETILTLRPDLVLASTHAPLESLKILEGAGISTLALYSPEKYEGAYQIIEMVGKILGATTVAAELLEDMRERTSAVLTRAAKLSPKPRVYYVVGFGEGGDWTATGDTFIHQMLSMAGGMNIAADATGWSFSLERLLMEEPDMIILNHGLADSFKTTPIYAELQAVREGKVFEVNENIIVRQGPRLIDGLETLNDLFGT